ncbi:xanthan lyase [Dysgonomonas sp. OttesenSCG-928-D17]|nr:xanthan lyase [Dysgonomonas sp. OttesenSCG-928-D17]
MSVCRRIAVLFVLFFFIQNTFSQGTLSEAEKLSIGKFLTSHVMQKTRIPPITIDSVSLVKNEIRLFAGVPLSYMIIKDKDVETINAGVKALLPEKYKKYKVSIFSDGYPISDYLAGGRKERFRNKISNPLVTRISQPNTISKGLGGRHLVVWQSHGRYYNQKERRWKWQRARVFQTVEDLYTQSYILPYIVPMLENAGANVLIPRERDTQKHEVIIDADASTAGSIYEEKNGKERWGRSQGYGFAHLKPFYLDGENPFEAGTHREIKTVTKETENSFCSWIPDMPEKGEYAVYISYKSLKNSAPDARYTVFHSGGETEFLVNQQIGGGTWIYLGKFTFDKGFNRKFRIELSNKSARKGSVVTADAVKIGGGMGNIARQPNLEGVMTENVKSSEAIKTDSPVKDSPKIDVKPEISLYPRYTEASRYWLQWAGAPDSIYSKSKGTNDYTDDYQSRAYWVNYIAGGSSILPEKEGLGIPVDLAFAFHTDAGVTYNDSIIGTLGICMTHYNDELFENKKPRILSRDLTQYIMEEIERGIRTHYEPEWTTRHIWNRSYAEARIPEVPTMLLELLSHQNFADMKYGLDPRFQFEVSRAVYKGMLKFVAEQYRQEYVVQPLPVNTFSLDFAGQMQVKLEWQPTIDSLENSAIPDSYIVYTKIGDSAFDNGRLVKENFIELDIEKDKIYSYKVTAVNAGGQSFPSEILSVCRKSEEKGCVLVVNGFDRVSAPHSFQTSDSIAGFVDAIDHGVPHISQYNYIGSQKEFRRRLPWLNDDSSGFGDSYSDYETTVVAGNTFDYPFVHGEAIIDNGYSFISASRDAVVKNQVSMNKYRLVDIILGKQKQTRVGRGVFGYNFKTFTPDFQAKIKDYCNNKGNIFVSGAFVASDLWDNDCVEKADKDFAQQVLKYKWMVGQAARKGTVKTVASPFEMLKGDCSFYNELNEKMYVVESPDALEPANDDSFTFLRYSENGLSAGVASSGEYKTVVVGFPFETIKSKEERNAFMGSILEFTFEK